MDTIFSLESLWTLVSAVLFSLCVYNIFRLVTGIVSETKETIDNGIESSRATVERAKDIRNIGRNKYETAKAVFETVSAVDDLRGMSVGIGVGVIVSTILATLSLIGFFVFVFWSGLAQTFWPLFVILSIIAIKKASVGIFQFFKIIVKMLISTARRNFEGLMDDIRKLEATGKWSFIFAAWILPLVITSIVGLIVWLF